MSAPKSTAESVGVLVGCLAFLAAPFLTAWIVMLALGGIHTAFPAVPPLGYWLVFVCLAAVNIAAAVVRRAVRR